MRSTDMNSMWPMIKVCGVRTLGDLTMLKQAGVTAVGINLVPRSPRFVDLKLATELCAASNDLGLLSVAVMLNPDEAAIAAALEDVRADVVQLHGQENVDLIKSFPAAKFIKAISWSGREQERQLATRWRSTVCADTGQPQRRSRALEPRQASGIQAFLVDAYAPSLGGGSGRLARWDLLCPRPSELAGVPLILAGGLNAENVSAAVDETQPQGVDVASGVELSPGKKSPEKVAAFANNARQAFASMPASG